MSEADVSSVHDEDVLRRMWQQTEDFSKKKEIRAHMYRLREERLRNLYSPEPTLHVKGREFRPTSMSFEDQSFQSLKSKEVRDAGSPPPRDPVAAPPPAGRDLAALRPPHAADLKELSNAGWTVESEDRTTDAGQTRLRSVQANIEGQYDVEGGRGQFAAHEGQRRARTDLTDGSTSLTRDETVAESAAHEQIHRKTDDGAQFSSKTTSSSTSSTIQQVSSQRGGACESRDEADSTQQHVEKLSNANNVSILRDEGELVSRKVEYPEDGMKVVTETRRLPDGSRVTSTRREFCASTALKTTSEQRSQQTRSETRHSTENKSDITETSTKTGKAVDKTHNMKAESQQFVDNKTRSDVKHESHKLIINDTSADIRSNHEEQSSTKNVSSYKETKDEDYSTTGNLEYSKTSKQHDIDNTRRESLDRDSRFVKETRQSQDEKEMRVRETEEKETSSNMYQTTYQSDYSQKKRISNDWSPSHQAWASTLRADSVATSKTNSNQSLRSSVSPDKTYRNPTSRSGSPSKFDRQSATRADCITNHLTATEIKNTKSTISRSLSPEKKNEIRNRPSTSPGKQTQENTFRLSSSPDRKVGDRPPSVPRDVTRPEKSRPSPDPDSRSAQHSDMELNFDRPKSIERGISPMKSTVRPSSSPERISGYSYPSISKDSPSTIPARDSVSPDRKPGYMRQTAASQPANVNYPSKSQSPERKTYENKSTLTKAKENHYKFVDEETKMYIHTGTEEVKTKNRLMESPDKYVPPVVTRKSPAKDTTDFSSSKSPLAPSLKKSRSPSPPKGPVTFTEKINTKENHTDKKEQVNSHTDASTHYKNTEYHQRTSLEKNSQSSNPVREQSPPKYGTYDKKRRSEEVDDYSNKDTKYDSLSQRNKTTVKKESSEPINPTRKSPRNIKSPSKDKYNLTSNFINTEKRTEEISKTIMSSRPRQLVTPSTSPTRNPKTVEKEPSTGQSSPTTSVSEFSYFSPTQQMTNVVTDLDEHNFTESTKVEEFKRPDTLNFKDSPSPSKIPCRSPSVEKKDNLSRKSSLKKPTNEKVSPVEKPPSTFKVSPSDESHDFLRHKVVKNDIPDKVEDKIKPPLERRETYEERCRKILGMMEDDKIKTETKTPFTVKTDFNPSSASVSPFPSPKENITFTKITDSDYNIADFLSREKEEMTKTSRQHNVFKSKSKTPTRESSPTKLKDIMSDTKTVTIKTENVVKDNLVNRTTKTNQPQSRSSVSPTRKIINHSKITTTKTETMNDQVETEDINTKNVSVKDINKKTSIISKAHDTPSTLDRSVSPTKKPEILKSRSPSPTKTTSKITDESTKLIISEREQEVIDKVQKSLRKLSPSRDSRSPNPGKSPAQTPKSVTDISQEYYDELIEIAQNSAFTKDAVNEVTKDLKSTEQKTTVKPASRNASPVKKSTVTTSKTSHSETSTKYRSTSPRKPVSTPDRPASPQVPKMNGTKPKETINKRPSQLYTPTKIDKTTPNDKKSVIPKQNSLTSKTTAKHSVTTKVQTPNSKSTPKASELPEPKRESPKGNKENVSPKKDDSKINRTPSDTTIKAKKPAPSRVKSKPEIQVTEVTTKTTKHSDMKTQKSSTRDTQNKLTSKPKSATALNTESDEHDIIVDVEQAKSSRENSPDRICPTPVGFLEDVGTPRYPDEVSEPDDEFQRRTHHTIHETESLVDDIVEISEEEELFSKRTDNVRESDECLLSVNDKVSKFTSKIDSVNKPKQSITSSKDTEKRENSDFIDENLKSDECLLSVSQKVSKFANVTDSKSPSRGTKITDEYDNETIYTDDYSKRSINDKANYFVETAKKVTVPKTKIAQKIERPDLSDVDDSLRSDECLLSVSDKVNKFVKTAEQFFSESTEIDDKEKKIREQHEKIMKVVQNMDISDDEETYKKVTEVIDKPRVANEDVNTSSAKGTISSHAKNKDFPSSNLKSIERTPIGKITTLRSSEAVKKAKALFENIASTTQKTKETTTSKTTKLTDIGVIKKSPKTDSTTVLHPSLENVLDAAADADIAAHNGTNTSRQSPARSTLETTGTKSYSRPLGDTFRNVPSPDISRPKSPTHPTHNSTKSVLSRYPASQRAESPKISQDKPQDQPHYQLPTMTSQLKEETKVEYEVSSRRGSGKFGVELRRTSLERCSISSERPRPADSRQPCIEDIFDLSLLEQMLEKVSGYEQRRRIRAQIRVAKKRHETESTINTNTFTRTTTKSTSPTPKNRSPERPKTQKTLSPDRNQLKEKIRPIVNGHAKESVHTFSEKQVTSSVEKKSRPLSPEKKQRPNSPEKMRAAPKTRSPIRQPSPEKRPRNVSPSKVASPKTKPNRFNEYASAYMKRVGINDTEALKSTNSKSQKSDEVITNVTKTTEVQKSQISRHESSSAKTYTSRTSSKDTIDVVQVNGKRSPSPEKRASPTDRLYYRSPSPDFKRPRSDDAKTKQTTIKIAQTKTDPKPTQNDKPSWITNRNLKKISSESRTFSSKKLESERKVRERIETSAPTDVITSSYGIGPLGADGKPLFGIKALRNGATNYQVKGTVVTSSYHSTNGSEPTGSVSVTAYSTSPEHLDALLASRGEPPSRLHGLAAITTVKTFGGGTGVKLQEALTKEDRAEIEQFTHQDRKVTHTNTQDVSDTEGTHTYVEHHESIEDTGKEEKSYSKRVTERKSEERQGTMHRREDRTTVRQSSVKSLTEKFIKNASDTSRSERVSYPKAGLILRSSSSNSMTRAERSPGSGGEGADTVTTTTTRTTQVQSSPRGGGGGAVRSFLDNNTKVTGVQDILTRMKNADIVVEPTDSCEEAEARALLNKYLGASVLMAGMRAYVVDPADPARIQAPVQHQARSGVTSSKGLRDIDIEGCWDEKLLKKLLEETTDYEQRRRLRARLRSLMAEQEACAEAVNAALASSCGEVEAAAAAAAGAEGGAREEEEVTTVTSSVRRNSSEKSVSSNTTTTTTTKSSKVIESRPAAAAATAPKVSPFAKFRQLEKQNSTTNPSSPRTPQSPGSPAPFFKFTDPALQASASTIKERLLQWCRDKTRDYENVKLENFSTSWADGLAFCALLHHFLPEAFDYTRLTPERRRHNFTLAFKVADEKAGIYPLLDVDDMVAMRKPDWKCVFTYVQSIHRRFKDEQ